MKKKSPLFLLVMFSLIGTFSCKQIPKNVNEYLRWINDPKNNLVQRKYVNGLEISMKYLPADYLAYLELKNSEDASLDCIDSLGRVYKNGLNFLFSIGPDRRNRKGKDIMLEGLNSHREYKQRALMMNFSLQENVYLTIGKSLYRPVLSNLENSYGLSTARHVQLVFVPKNNWREFEDSDHLCLSYDDQLFGIGMNHFVFEKNQLKNVPTMSFWE